MDGTDSPQAVALRRLRWRCRRGMLENDLLLEHYLDRRVEQLDAAALADLDRLLDYDDVTLWELLSGRAHCEDAGMQRIVEEIRAA